MTTKILLTLAFLVLFAGAAQAATYTVTNTNDGGAGSLRAAMTAANAGSSVDLIEFNIAGSGVKTINLDSPLPSIVHDLTIDGTSQTGWSGAPLIELNGLSAGGGSIGLELTGGTLTVRGLIINRFTGYGIKASCLSHCGYPEAPTISLNVYGSYIGTNSSGTGAASNGVGIYLETDRNGGGQISSNIGGKSANERNVISGNIGNGLELSEIETFGLQKIHVFNNYIGTNAAGTAALPNLGSGIIVGYIRDGSVETVQIGDGTSAARNLISGNSKSGVVVQSYASIKGNRIGTNAIGTADLGNGNYGVYSGGITVIGGAAVGEGNLISGNNKSGIYVGNNTEAAIYGNYIGTNAAGTAAVGNTESGVYTQSHNFKIGGSNAGEGNLISGNGDDGVVYSPSNYGGGWFNFTYADIDGNKIGVNAALTAAVGNGGNGISVDGYDLEIGDTEPGTANFIGGNAGHGIRVFKDAGRTAILSNYIGTNSGSTDLGNGGDGIHVNCAAANTAIGYDGSLSDNGSPYGNFIAYNNGDGIEVAPEAPGDPAPAAIRIRTNSIYTNGELGIDLGANGVTLNDALDADAGANGSQNFPVLSKASAGQIAGGLHSTPNKDFIIDFYRVEGIDSSGYGEGRAYLTSATVTTNANGDASFNRSGLSLTVGQYITATATGAEGTSEFSQNITVTQPPGNVALSAASYSVNESAGAATITVNRTGAANGIVGVNYATSNVTATAGSDYTAVSSTVLLFDGQTSGTFSIPITNDNSHETNETLQITLTSTNGGAVIINPSTATLTITNDDNPPTISIADVSKDEGNEATTAFNFNVTLSAPSAFPVSVAWATTNAGASATAGQDYTAASGTLNFAVGESSKPVTVSVNGDLTTEINETFFVNLSSPTNSTIADAQGIGTIQDDDNPGILQFALSPYNVNENTGFATATVTRTGGDAGTVTVDFSTANSGTASADSDFTGTSGTLVFLDGETSKTFTVAILDDQTTEQAESINLILSNPTGGATFGASTAIINILDNDNAPPIAINGTVKYGITPLNQPQKTVSGVFVSASGASASSDMTDSFGAYSLGNLQSGGQYTLNASKTGNIDGISPFDATLVLRHVAANGQGPNALSVNQQKAADANGNGSISPFDATQILRFVAANGQTPNTGAVGNWEFLPSVRSYDAVNTSLTEQNYEAVLIGDVNGNWTPADSLAPETENQEQAKEVEADTENAEIEISLPTDVTVVTGSTIVIPVAFTNHTDKAVSAYSFGVKYDPAVLQPEAAMPIDQNKTLSEGLTVVHSIANAGRLGISAAGAASQNLTRSRVLLKLHFKVLGIGNASQNGSTPLTFDQKPVFEDAFGSAVTVKRANGSAVITSDSNTSSVTVAGRIITANAKGIRNVLVTLTAADGETRVVQTGAGGYYRFAEVPAGETYTISVSAKNYTFNQNSQIRNVFGDTQNIDFTADAQVSPKLNEQAQ